MKCNVDLIKKSIVEDARLLVINSLGPSNFEKPDVDKPLVYIGDRVDSIELSEAAVTSWAANRFKPKFASNWVSGETRGKKTHITISIPENLRLALNVKYGGLSLAEANASLKGIDPDSLETGLTGFIKPGVEELFESNPELANAVYSALGFINTSEIQLDKPRFNPDNFEATSYPIKINGKYAGVISVDKDGYISSSIGMAGVELEKEFQDQGYGTKVYIALAEQLVKEGKTLKSEAFGKTDINESANRVWKSLLDKGYAVDKGTYFEIQLKDKQQAQQLYSQYLDTIFPDSKVKDIVYHIGSIDKNSKFDRSKIGPYSKLDMFYFSSFDTVFHIKNELDYLKYWVLQGTTSKKLRNLVLKANTKEEVIKIARDNIKSPNLESNIKQGLNKGTVPWHSYEEMKGTVHGWGNYSAENKDVIKAILDVKNPILENTKNAYVENPNKAPENRGKYPASTYITNKEYDSYLISNQDIGVKNPEQIHILGSKQDIEGFKEFVRQGSVPKSEYLFQTKNIFSAANEIENKLKSINRTINSIGSQKNVDNVLKRAGLDSELRTQFIKLVNDNPSLKSLKVSEVLSIYLKEFIKDSDRQYYKAIDEPLSNELENILINYFDKFKIKRKELDNLKEKFGVDSIGVFDVLAKTIYYAKNRNLLTLPEEYGHVFVELLGSIGNKKADNPLFKYMFNNIDKWDGYKRVLRDYKDVYVTAEGNIDIYKIKKEAIGQAIGIALVRNYKVQKGDKEFWSKIQEIIDYILNLIKGIDYVSLNTTVDSIAKDILNNNYDKLDRLKKDTSKYNLLSYSETIKNQNKKDGGIALKFMQWFSEKGMIITGSLAYRLQGNVYRPEIDALHDIDNIVPSNVHKLNLNKSNFLNEEQLERDKIYRKLISEGKYKEAKQYKVQGNLRLNLDEMIDQVEVLQDFKKNFPDTEFLYSFFNQKANAYYVTINAIWSKNQELKDRFKSYSGSFNKRLENFTREEVEQIYLFDFFLRPESSEQYVQIEDTEYGLSLAHFNYSFYEKLNMLGRAKDAFDYQMWDYFNEDNILAPDFNDRLVYFQLQQNNLVSKQETESSNIITQEDLVSIAARELVEENKALAEMGAATTQGNDTARATNAVSKLVDQINSYAERIGVEYEILSTVEEAANIIGNANTIGGLSANSIIASGASAFFYNGKVYFIASRLSTSDIFHEFGHPIIKAIANIEGQKLFNSLYNEAIGTNEGFAIYQQMLEEFPEGSENTDDFKEELIMRSLDRIHASEKFGEPVSASFKSYVKKLFFNVKQFLRKVFGTKVKVEKLSAKTTLAELAEMIAGDKFSIDIPKITTEDFVAFRTATARTISEINKIADEDLFILMDDYRRTLSTIKAGLGTNNIKDLEKLLFGDAENKKVLAESLSDISGALNDIDELKLAAATAVQIERQKTIAANRLAENLNSIGNIIKLLEDSIVNVDPNSLSSDDQKAFIAKLTYANTIIAYVNELFFNTQDAMKKAGVSEKSAEWQTITEFFGKVPSFERTVNQKQIKVLSGFTSSIVEDMRQSVIEKAKRDLKKAISENPSIGTKIDNGFEKLTDSDFTDVNARVRNQLEKVYNSFKDDYQALTRDAMESILSGNYKDNGRLNALFESYTNNQNPVVGSFAAFYKQQQAMAEAKTTNEVEKFMAGLRPLVEGMSQDEIANMSKDFVFEDKTFRINNDNEVEERLVLTYLNKFKDYRYELKKREIAYENASRKGTFAERSAAYAELQQFKKDYMWQKYAQEYYELDKIYFDAGQVGIDALLEKQILLDQINSTQRSAITETELFDKNGEIEALQRRYRQLFSMTYEDGITPKQGDDLVKTELHRAYRERSNSFVNYDIIPGAFERALRNYLDELALTETPGTPEYYAKRDEWIRINSQIEYTDDYYDARREAIQNLRDFSETYLPDSAEAKLIVENYNIIYSLLSVFRDTDNQPDAEEIGVDRLKNIKRLHEEIETARDNMSGVYGLSKTERLELSSYFDIINSGASLNVYEQKRFDKLLAKQKSGGLSKALTAQYKKLIAAVSELTYKSPTTQYLDKMNYWLNDVLNLGLPEITEENADEYLDYDKMYNYLKLDPNFKQWFEDNHYVKEYYDKDLEEIVYTYKRISAWEVARPTDENYLKETKLNIIDEATGLPMVIKRVPKARFKKRSVKDEFRLVKENEDPAKYIGIYYDNRGKYLPRDYKPGDPNSAKSDLLINQEYEKLRVSDPKKFAILEYLKNEQLKEEEKLNQNYAKLYLDVPRYGLKKGFEDVKNKAKTVQQNLRSIKGMLNRQKLDDDVSAELMAEEGLNIDANLAFVDTDILGNTREVIPIGGMTAFENDRVSRDVVRGHIKRMIDIAKFNVLQETAPVAKAFMETLNNNQPKDMNAIDRRQARTTGKLEFTKSKSDSNVAGEAMAYFYQREYLGKARGEEMDPVIDKMVKGLMKQVSFGYFALDLASAAKNYFSQLIQNGIETAGGEYINAQSLAAGKAMAYAHVTKNLFQRLDRNTKDLSSQMILAFDPVQDRYKDDFADSYTNSLWNELASVKLFMAPRRFLERESVLELFFGMMHKKLIEQTLPDGKTKVMIRYSDAFEVNADGEMILKSGIDKKYAVGGSEFAKFRIIIQEKANLLYGTYAKFDQPMAGKYFAYRLGSFLRRYFTSMFLNRWAFRLEKGGSLLKASTYKYRYNWALNEMTRGYYVESMIALVKTIKTVGAYIPYMPKSEAIAIRKTLYDFMAATLLAILPKLLFGYESGDDDRFEKLRALSGPLGSDNFEIDGWLAQHSIYQMKAVFGETTTFIPVPGLGEAEVLDMATVSNLLLGRGIGNYTTLFLDLYYISMGDDRAVYKRDMGPFSWQEKGDYKIYNHLGKMAGIKGKFWDPVLAIKAQETVEAMGQSR